MNEELENVLNSESPKNQDGKTVGMESESSVVGIIFTVLAWLNLIVGVFLMIAEFTKDYNYERDFTHTFALLGSSLFLFAIAGCLKLLAKISFRVGCIMKAVEK
jgi:hypothetical protein